QLTSWGGSPAIVASRDHLLVAWSQLYGIDSKGVRFTVQFALTDHSGKIAAWGSVAPLDVSQTMPRVASDGERLFVIWNEIDPTHRRLRGVTIGRNGETSSPLEITSTVAVNDRGNARPGVVAWDGGRYVV